MATTATKRHRWNVQAHQLRPSIRMQGCSGSTSSRCSGSAKKLLRQLTCAPPRPAVASSHALSPAMPKDSSELWALSRGIASAAGSISGVVIIAGGANVKLRC